MNQSSKIVAAIFDAQRICIINTAEKSCRDNLVRDLENGLGLPMIRLHVPEPEEFRGFLNAALDQVCDSMRFKNHYDGIVAVELDEREYLHNEVMVLALLELLCKITTHKLVLFGGSEKLSALLAGCAARFAVPGFVKVEKESHRELIVETAQSIGVEFDTADTMDQAVSLCEELYDSPAFRPEALLLAFCSGSNALITSRSIQAEQDNPTGYVQICRAMNTKQSGKPNAHRRIGFQSTKTEKKEDDELVV